MFNLFGAMKIKSTFSTVMKRLCFAIDFKFRSNAELFQGFFLTKQEI